LRHKFGIPDDVYGLQKRQITKVPEGLEWVETKEFAGFWTKPYKDAKIENYRIPAKQLYTAWNEVTFVVFSNNPNTIKQLRQVYEAICRLDAEMWVGGGGLFQNAGFIICIASIIPKETTDQWEAADKEREAIQKEFAATGIAEKLRLADKRYFALSPRRGKKGGLEFYLNPYEQHKYNYGPVTLKDLEDWINEKGKIVMTPAQRAECHMDEE
jgi:hypothetical protein